jgi:hypothetical protein
MTADRKKQVSVEAESDLEIDPGLILPKGIYRAIETQLPVPAFSGLTALDSAGILARFERRTDR